MDQLDFLGGASVSEAAANEGLTGVHTPGGGDSLLQSELDGGTSLDSWGPPPTQAVESASWQQQEEEDEGEGSRAAALSESGEDRWQHEKPLFNSWHVSSGGDGDGEGEGEGEGEGVYTEGEASGEGHVVVDTGSGGGSEAATWQQQDGGVSDKVVNGQEGEEGEEGEEEEEEEVEEEEEEEESAGISAQEGGEERLWKVDVALNLLLSFLLYEEEARRKGLEEEREIQMLREETEAEYRSKIEALKEAHRQMMAEFDLLEEVDLQRRKRMRTLLAVSAGTAVATRLASQTATAAMATAATTVSASSVERKVWVKERSQAWWDRCCDPSTFSPAEFQKGFRMSRETFEHICEELGEAIGKEDTLFRAAVPVQKRVAVCIWRLATGESLRMLAKRFGLGISTCHSLVIEVCAAINDILLPKYVQWPNDSQMVRVMQSFEQISGLQNVVGAIYTTHIPIATPRINVGAYFNKHHTLRNNNKTSYSITLQGTMDARGAFTDVCIGWPGSMADAQVLQNSAIYQRGIRGSLEGCWVVGGKSYPLLDWLLVPYSEVNPTWAQHNFNEKVWETIKVAKDGFSRLKGRWRFLHHRTEVKLQELPAMLGACCVLHNVCEQRNEGYDAELNYEVFDDEIDDVSGMHSHRAAQARDAIAMTLFPHVSWGPQNSMGGVFLG